MSASSLGLQHSLLPSREREFSSQLVDRNSYIRSNDPFAPGSGPGQALSVAPFMLRLRRETAEFILSDVEGLSTNGAESKGELAMGSSVTLH